MYSPLSGSYYFVPRAHRIADSTTLRIVGDRVDVTESVQTLVASAVAGHLRQLARSKVFDLRGYRKLLAAAREVEKNAGIDAPDHEE